MRIKLNIIAETLSLPRLDCEPWQYKSTEINIGGGYDGDMMTVTDNHCHVLWLPPGFQTAFVACISSFNCPNCSSES